MSGDFFRRWSRRKLENSPAQAQGDTGLAGNRPQQAPDATAGIRSAGRGEAPGTLGEHESGTAPHHADSAVHQEQVDLPTLQDVQNLTPQDDFVPFMQRGVTPEVRNAAMKKLFADPHFNVMDGLDIYIDDYSQPDPMPAGMLAKMASAQFLRLVSEVPPQQGRHTQDPDASAAPVQAAQVVAQSPDSSAPAEPPQHDHTDLQLQPDTAPADPRPGAEPRRGID